MFLKPNTGRTIRDPVKGTFLPESGAEVPDNTFWRRRLRDADVSITAPTEKTVTPTAATASSGTAVNPTATPATAATLEAK
jgi:hypothetical protein